MGANWIKRVKGSGGAQPFLKGRKGIAAISAGVGHISGHRGSARKHHVVADRNVRRDHGIAAGNELPAYLGRAAHHETGGEESVLAEVAVVRNMTNVVQLGA